MPAGRQEDESMKAVVTVFGGSGFLGRRVVRRLLESGFAVRVATRHPQPSDRPGLTQVAADANDECAVAAAVEGACGVVNAVSLYVERGGQTIHSVHVEAARREIGRASCRDRGGQYVELSGAGVSITKKKKSHNI